MSTSVLTPFPLFYDADGVPLEEGYIYVGVAGLNPETNPQLVYWDSALTIVAAQPIRTLNGYPSNSGTPGMIYTGTTNFSVTVKTKASVTVYSTLSNTYASNLGTMSTQNANAVAITGGTITGLSSPLPVASGGTAGNTQAAARTGLGLGTMSTQGAGAVAITGGTIDGTAIGDTTAGAGTFTDLTGRIRLSSETTGTLTAVSANRLILASGGVTLPASVFQARDIIVIDGNGGARTITRGAGLTMNFAGVDTASVTLTATGTMGIYYRSATVCIITGAIS
jgi:hypothetical protein